MATLSERNSYEVHAELMGRVLRLEAMLALLTRTTLSGVSLDADRELLLNLAGVIEAEITPKSA